MKPAFVVPMAFALCSSSSGAELGGSASAALCPQPGGDGGTSSTAEQGLATAQHVPLVSPLLLQAGEAAFP